MARLVALPARGHVYLVPSGRVVDELAGLDGFSLKKIGKFVDKNKWLIAGAATAAVGGWALAGKAVAGKVAAGAAGKAAATAVAKKAGTSLLSKVGSSLLKGGKAVAKAAAPLATTVGTQMLQNAIAPQAGAYGMDPYGAGAYGMDPYGMTPGMAPGMAMDPSMPAGGWGGGGGMPAGPNTTPSWLLPAAIGGGVLLVLLMSGKKS